MRSKLLAASLLAVGLAGSALAQTNPAPAGSTMDKNHTTNGAASGTMKMKKVDKTVTNSTARTLNKQNCKSVNGKGSLQTQGGSSGTENTEDTCADNNN
ncbi:hypothetical protein J2W42_003999 [Rhizobium tibeticum]|uniref:hypothetical protein n=1 Tax=Rhizobium tibeticum TaxID=501024 RepID=UPI00278B8A48|nr:hypothetical protein [Rhizobium tibeticum]MDP9811136.1 hypothetical protein [Rhizobium tibeticum]